MCVCQTLFTDKKMKENYYWSRSRVDHFYRDCHLNLFHSNSICLMLLQLTDNKTNS